MIWNHLGAAKNTLVPHSPQGFWFNCYVSPHSRILQELAIGDFNVQSRLRSTKVKVSLAYIRSESDLPWFFTINLFSYIEFSQRQEEEKSFFFITDVFTICSQISRLINLSIKVKKCRPHFNNKFVNLLILISHKPWFHTIQQCWPSFLRTVKSFRWTNVRLLIGKRQRLHPLFFMLFLPVFMWYHGIPGLALDATLGDRHCSLVATSFTNDAVPNVVYWRSKGKCCEDMPFFLISVKLCGFLYAVFNEEKK